MQVTPGLPSHGTCRGLNERAGLRRQGSRQTNRSGASKKSAYGIQWNTPAFSASLRTASSGSVIGACGRIAYKS